MTTNAVSHRHLVVFSVDDQAYALPLNQVSRAVRMVALTSMPEAAPWIAGFVNVAGCITPVVNLRRRLGGEGKAPDPNECLLIIAAEGQDFALIVDQVSEVLEWRSSQLESPPDCLFPTQARLTSGVFQHGESLILVLDPNRLL